MPRMTRVRLASLGPPKARIDDLTIPLTAPDGRAADSVIWLRNAGGKSTILALVLAMLEPDRRHFLGIRSDHKQRELEDYIDKEDRALVVAEWELDVEAQMDLAPPPRFLTGVLQERHYGGGSGKPEIRRLFFAGKVLPDVDALTLEGLPYYIERDGALHRRGRTSFRQEWVRLRQEHPSAELSVHESQTEWRERLASLGIDSELFLYQVRMNEKEGGADAVFQFNRVADFVRMFLEMVLRPSAGNEASSNLALYRDKLRRRTLVYQPEAKLIEGLIGRMKHVLAVAAQRTDLRQTLMRAAREAAGLAEHIRQQLARVDAEWQQARDQVEEQQELARAARELEREHRKAAARAANWRLEQELEDIALRISEAEATLVTARHRERVWEAADKLAESRRHEQEAQQFREQIEARLEEHRPLRDRLRQAAERYGSALVAAIKHLDVDLADRRAAAAKIEEEIQGSRREEQAQGNRAAVADERARSADEARGRAEKARLAFEADGIIEPHESIPAALRTLDGRATELEEAARMGRARQAEIDAQVEEGGKERAELAAKRSRVETQREQLGAEIEKAEARKTALEANPLLVQYLGVAEPDLETLAPDAPDQLEEQADQLERDGHRLHVAQAADDRSIRYLEDTDLLPPSLDVEAVLQALQGSVQGWAGWHYIAKNLPDIDRRRALVRRHPEVATGVVVRDEDVEKARSVLASARPEVEEAVTLAGASVVLDESSEELFVVGPTHNARIDQGAGREERTRRVALRSEREIEIDALRQRRRALDDLAKRLRSFQAEYGNGWFAARREEIRDAASREDALDRQIASVLNRLRTLRDERVRVGEDVTGSGERLAAVRAARQRLHAFLEQHPEGVEGYERVAEAARADADDARRKAAVAAERTAELEAEYREHTTALREVGDRRRERQSELDAIPELASRPEPEAGDLDALVSQYASLRSEYEGKVKDDVLKSKLDEAERNASIYRKQFLEACRKKEVEPEEVAEAIDRLPNRAAIDAEKEKASSEVQAARGTIGGQRSRRIATEDRLKDLQQTCAELGISGQYDDPADAPGSVDAARDRETSERERAEEAREAAEEAAAMAAMFDKEVSDLNARRNALKMAQQTVSTLRGSHASLLPSEFEVEGWEAPLTDAELSARSDQLGKDLAQAEETDRALSDRGERAYRDFREWLTAEQFVDLKSTLIHSLGRHSARSLEDEAEDINDQLEQRLQIIRDEIENIDRDRDDVVAAVQKEAEEAIHMLKSLERHSRLPEDLPYEALRGQHVLRVTTGEPQDPGARKARVGDFLDALVSEGRTLAATDLVIESALRLGHEIKVSILSPDPGRRERRPITDLAVMSGGERMTCATMLYCALARLRARNRGSHGHASSVLLLDNPLGTASWRSLVELQRAMAKSMNIQLVYLTGVRDYEAVSAMTNIVRLRNGRVDVRTGERVVEFDGQIEGPAQLQQKAPATSPEITAGA